MTSVYHNEREKSRERAGSSPPEPGTPQLQMKETLRRSANRWLAKARVRGRRRVARVATGAWPGTQVREERVRAMASLRTVINSIILLRPPSLGSFLRPAFNDRVLECLYQTHHLLQGHSLLPVFYGITVLLSVHHMFDGLRTLACLRDQHGVQLLRDSSATPIVVVSAIYIELATILSAVVAFSALLIAPLLYFTSGLQSAPRTRDQRKGLFGLAQCALGIDPTCGAQWLYLMHRVCSYGWFLLQVSRERTIIISDSNTR